jgi:alanine racemase
MSSPNSSAGILTIDLAELARNWLLLKSHLNSADCGAVIKANAYGLGAGRAIAQLCQAGCKEFFVALIDEGIYLRKVLKEASLEANIHILGGPMAAEQTLVEHGLIPVLNSIGDIALWKEKYPQALADIHIDTGMSRLGLPPSEVGILQREPQRIKGLNISHVISHLACSEDPNTAMNAEQLESFLRTITLFPGCKASLANSSGIFLGDKYHFDLTRPGAALYGVNPTPGEPNPMSQVIKLQGKILQVRGVDAPQSVGYGATHRIKKKGRIATVGVGYADGYLRSLSNSGIGFLGGIRVPLVGRVSMDLITFDVSDVPEQLAYPGALIDLIGPINPVDDVADAAGTIGYEILTSLGSRYHRIYTENS